MSVISDDFVVGERVLVGSKKGTIRYIGDLEGTTEIYYGVELDDTVGSCDGKFLDHRFFQCAPNHGMFTPRATLRKLKASQKSSRSERKLDRRHGQHEAATKIQSLARGKTEREKVKQETLWKTWNQLDWKEEQELRETHGRYENLKRVHKEKKVGNADTTDPDSTDSGNSASTPDSTSSIEHTNEDTHKHHHKHKHRRHKHRHKHKKHEHKDNDVDPLELKWPLELDYVTCMMDHFKYDRILPIDHVVQILAAVEPILASEPNVVHITVSTRVTVVGDIHGQLDDLLAIFKLNGLPSPRNVYLFNGDFVDRGQYSCEVVLILLVFKVLYPDCFHLNRGNHEARDINSRDGFEKECLLKYNMDVFDTFSRVFSCLPIAHILDNQTFIVHGGLAWDDLTVDDIQKLDRFQEIPEPDGTLEQLLWSDPGADYGRYDSPRGAGLLFGPDVTAKFLMTNQFDLLVRSHECMPDGFEWMHEDSLITVFSASHYCGTAGNNGAYLVFEKNDTHPACVPFYAKSKDRLSRYRLRHALLENDIISKLLQRISDNRLGLIDYYLGVEEKEGTLNDPHLRGTITRDTWAEGLKEVLKLQIPFLEFQDYMGLPKLGIDGKRKGRIDYMAFLLRFKPFNSMMKFVQHKDRETQETMDALVHLLSSHRYHLESLFRHFDSNGDMTINKAEFREGLLSLQSLLDAKEQFTEHEVDLLMEALDGDHDGLISYTEFFNNFALKCSELSSQLRPDLRNPQSIVIAPER